MKLLFLVEDLHKTAQKFVKLKVKNKALFLIERYSVLLRTIFGISRTEKITILAISSFWLHPMRNSRGNTLRFSNAYHINMRRRRAIPVEFSLRAIIILLNTLFICNFQLYIVMLSESYHGFIKKKIGKKTREGQMIFKKIYKYSTLVNAMRKKRQNRKFLASFLFHGGKVSRTLTQWNQIKTLLLKRTCSAELQDWINDSKYNNSEFFNEIELFNLSWCLDNPLLLIQSFSHA